MAMSSGSRLAWVQRNRCRKDRRNKTLQALIGDLAENLIEKDWRQAQEVAQHVASHVDQAFRSHCRVMGWEGNKLVVMVDHASLVAAMRTRWSRPLLDGLQPGINGRRVERILFKYGNTGAEIPSV